MSYEITHLQTNELAQNCRIEIWSYCSETQKIHLQKWVLRLLITYRFICYYTQINKPCGTVVQNAAQSLQTYWQIVIKYILDHKAVYIQTHWCIAANSSPFWQKFWMKNVTLVFRKLFFFLLGEGGVYTLHTYVIDLEVSLILSRFGKRQRIWLNQTFKSKQTQTIIIILRKSGVFFCMQLWILFNKNLCLSVPWGIKGLVHFLSSFAVFVPAVVTHWK